MWMSAWTRITAHALTVLSVGTWYLGTNVLVCLVVPATEHEMVLLLFGPWFYFALKHRALIELREQYFRQNGGLLLKQQVSAREGLTDYTRIFSSKELQCATAGYNNNRILGIGGNNTVYQGNLDGGTTVAIKKSTTVYRAQIKQFINDVVIFCQINHRNVIKLLSQIKL